MARTDETKAFVERWKKIIAAVPEGKSNEQQDTQKFWIDLLESVLGIPSGEIAGFVDFERKVRGRRIDVFVSDHHFLCEQKSVGVNLDEPELRNKTFVTPFQQAMWYAQNLPYSERPRWVMTCNFETFRLYDLDDERPEEGFQEFSLDELPNHAYLLSFLTSQETSRLHKEQQLSVEAGTYVSKLYDALAKQYHHIDTDAEEQRSLNVLITRVIFMLYAEDAGLLQSHRAFGRYCQGDPRKLRGKLVELFEVVDTPYDRRDEYLDEDLSAFPYINGGLFSDSSIVIPQMTEEIAAVIADASEGFDWKDISGVIFGAVFEGTLNPETRHAGGMHYTSVENIDRCLRPLFLDALWDELHAAEGERSAAKRRQLLDRLHDKIAGITIGDPACGSGNFLTEAYRQLRTIENRIIEDELGDQTALFAAMDNPVRVSLDQFYGIEINDFAVSVAKTALWITEEQMLRKTQEILPHYDFDFLPLKSLSNLVEGNALTTDWAEVFPEDLTYLVGNPPFLGARNMDKAQKAEIKVLAKDVRNAHDLDYVTGWYIKALDLMDGSRQLRAALVSTNSICQGAEVGDLWHYLIEVRGAQIDFAWRTFVWDNEAAEKAHVHCVIVGFSKKGNSTGQKTLFEEGIEPQKVRHINPYLMPAPDVFVMDRKKPISSVPEMANGNQPRDGGNLILSTEERDEVLSLEPSLERWIRPYVGSDEFIKGKKRYCLWLEEASAVDIAASKVLSERVRKVYEFRMASKAKTTNGYAKTPALFAQRPQKQGCDFLLVPMTSSERRNYIPIGYMDKSIVASNAVFVIPNADLFMFGVLQSQFHNAWMRVVAGRLKSDYRYSKEIVYNCFVWPECGQHERELVVHAAQRVLDERAKHSYATLAQMYDPKNEFMFPSLIGAHMLLDASVERAYGVDFSRDEEKIIEHLFKLYADKTADGDIA